LDVVLAERHKVYYSEGSGVSSQRLWAHVKLVLEIVPIKSTTPLSSNLHELPSFLGCAG